MKQSQRRLLRPPLAHTLAGLSQLQLHVTEFDNISLVSDPLSGSPSSSTRTLSPTPLSTATPNSLTTTLATSATAAGPETHATVSGSGLAGESHRSSSQHSNRGSSNSSGGASSPPLTLPRILSSTLPRTVPDLRRLSSASPPHDTIGSLATGTRYEYTIAQTTPPSATLHDSSDAGSVPNASLLSSGALPALHSGQRSPGRRESTPGPRSPSRTQTQQIRSHRKVLSLRGTSSDFSLWSIVPLQQDTQGALATQEDHANMTFHARTVDRVIELPQPIRGEPPTQQVAKRMEAQDSKSFDQWVYRVLAELRVKTRQVQALRQRMRHLRLRRKQRLQRVAYVDGVVSSDSDYATDCEDSDDNMKSSSPNSKYVRAVPTSDAPQQSDARNRDAEAGVDNEFKVLIDRFASTKVSAYETELFNLKNELERLLLKLRGAEARIAELEAEKTSYSHELRHFREIAEATEKLQLEAQATQAEALKTKEKLEHRLAKKEEEWQAERAQLLEQLATVESLNVELRSLRQSKLDMEKDAQRMRIALSEASSRASVATARIAELETALRLHQSESELQVAGLNDRIREYEPQVCQLKEELLTKTNALSRIELDLKMALSARDEALEQKEEALRAKKLLEATVAGILSERAQLKDQLLQATSQLALRNDEIATLNVTLNSSRQDASRRLAQLEEQIAVLAQDRDRLAQEASQLTQELINTQGRLRESALDVAGNTMTITQLQKEVEELKCEVASLQLEATAAQHLRVQLSDTNAELVALRYLAKQHENLLTESKELREQVEQLRAKLNRP